MYTSHLKSSLRAKYLAKRLQPYVALFLAFWLLWLCQLIVAIAHVPAVINIIKL